MLEESMSWTCVLLLLRWYRQGTLITPHRGKHVIIKRNCCMFVEFITRDASLFDRKKPTSDAEWFWMLTDRDVSSENTSFPEAVSWAMHVCRRGNDLGSVSWSILSVNITDKFLLSQSDARISVTFNICWWKSLTKSFMKCSPAGIWFLVITRGVKSGNLPIGLLIRCNICSW